MDAVQKVGNGHPGTAMSLAPAAYLLFQKVMRHNPADPHWPGRDRFVLSLRPLQPDPLHPALPRRLGPRARGPQGAAHLGQQDARATRSTATPPASRPPPARSARASATRSAWRWPPAASTACSTPNAALGDSPFDHHIYALCSDGDIEEGVIGRGLRHRRRPAARQPHPDLRRQPDLDRGQHRHRARRGRRRALRGLRLARAARRLDPRRHDVRGGRAGALRRDPQGRGGHRQAELHRAAHDHRLARPERAEHRQGPRLRARRRRGRGHQEGARLRPRADLRGADRASSSTPAQAVERGKAAQAAWDDAVRRVGARSPPPTRRSSTGCRRARCPRAGPTTCRRSRPTRRASPPAWPPAP